MRGQLQAWLPTPGFHGYLRTTFWGSEAGAVVQKLGWGTWGLDGLTPLQGPRQGQGPEEGHGQGQREKQEGGPCCHSLNSSPPALPPALRPAEAGRAWGTARGLARQPSGRGGEAGRATPIGHTLCPQGSWPCPCCPSCWGRAAGAAGLGPPSDLAQGGPRGNRRARQSFTVRSLGRTESGGQLLK